MLVDTATQKNHAAIGFCDSLCQHFDLPDFEVSNSSCPFEVILLILDIVTPLAPADDPAFAESFVVEPVLEQVMDDAEPERHVGPGTNRQPGIRLACGCGQARINHDHFCVMLQSPVV